MSSKKEQIPDPKDFLSFDADQARKCFANPEETDELDKFNSLLRRVLHAVRDKARNGQHMMIIVLSPFEAKHSEPVCEGLRLRGFDAEAIVANQISVLIPLVKPSDEKE